MTDICYLGPNLGIVLKLKSKLLFGGVSLSGNLESKATRFSTKTTMTPISHVERRLILPGKESQCRHYYEQFEMFVRGDTVQDFGWMYTRLETTGFCMFFPKKGRQTG